MNVLPTHIELINLIRTFDTNITGICNGYSHMLVQALLLTKEDGEKYYNDFFNRLERLSDKTFQKDLRDYLNDKSLKDYSLKRQTEILDCLAFFDAVRLHQESALSSSLNLTHKKNNGSMSKDIYPLTSSQEHPSIVMTQAKSPLLADESQLLKHLEDLEAYCHNEKMPGIFLVTGQNHAVVLQYNKLDNTWLMFDINDLPKLPSAKTRQELVDTLKQNLVVRYTHSQVNNTPYVAPYYNLRSLCLDNNFDDAMSQTMEKELNESYIKQCSEKFTLNDHTLATIAFETDDLNLYQFITNHRLYKDSATITLASTLNRGFASGALKLFNYAIANASPETLETTIKNHGSKSLTNAIKKAESSHEFTNKTMIRTLLNLGVSPITTIDSKGTTLLMHTINQAPLYVLELLLDYVEITVNDVIDALKSLDETSTININHLINKTPKDTLDQAIAEFFKSDDAGQIICASDNPSLILQSLQHPAAAEKMMMALQEEPILLANDKILPAVMAKLDFEQFFTTYMNNDSADCNEFIKKLLTSPQLFKLIARQISDEQSLTLILRHSDTMLNTLNGKLGHFIASLNPLAQLAKKPQTLRKKQMELMVNPLFLRYLLQTAALDGNDVTRLFQTPTDNKQTFFAMLIDNASEAFTSLCSLLSPSELATILQQESPTLRFRLFQSTEMLDLLCDKLSIEVIYEEWVKPHLDLLLEQMLNTEQWWIPLKEPNSLFNRLFPKQLNELINTPYQLADSDKKLPLLNKLINEKKYEPITQALLTRLAETNHLSLTDTLLNRENTNEYEEPYLLDNNHFRFKEFRELISPLSEKERTKLISDYLMSSRYKQHFIKKPLNFMVIVSLASGNELTTIDTSSQKCLLNLSFTGMDELLKNELMQRLKRPDDFLSELLDKNAAFFSELFDPIACPAPSPEKERTSAASPLVSMGFFNNKLSAQAHQAPQPQAPKAATL